MLRRERILILCTGNSCRSQMAEGLLRESAGDILEVSSAGSRPAGYVHEAAVAVMREIGIDISGQTSKPLEPFLAAGVDVVITVCDSAAESCPVFPGDVVRHHWGFEDPPVARRGGESELDAFRRVRDEIRRVFAAYAAGYRQALRGQPRQQHAQP